MYGAHVSKDSGSGSFIPFRAVARGDRTERSHLSREHSPAPLRSVTTRRTSCLYRARRWIARGLVLCRRGCVDPDGTQLATLPEGNLHEGRWSVPSTRHGGSSHEAFAGHARSCVAGLVVPDADRAWTSPQRRVAGVCIAATSWNQLCGPQRLGRNSRSRVPQTLLILVASSQSGD